MPSNQGTGAVGGLAGTLMTFNTLIAGGGFINQVLTLCIYW